MKPFGPFFHFFIHMIHLTNQKSKLENILRTKKEYITKLFYINNLFYSFERI